MIMTARLATTPAMALSIHPGIGFGMGMGIWSDGGWGGREGVVDEGVAEVGGG